MKFASGLYDLILVCCILMAAVPLLVFFVSHVSDDSFSYLDDKTVYEAEELEYDGYLNLNYGSAQLVSLIQDDFVPTEARNYYYDFTVNDTNIKHSISLETGWYGKKNRIVVNQLNKTDTSAIRSVHSNSTFYLEYDWFNEKWIISDKLNMPNIANGN